MSQIDIDKGKAGFVAKVAKDLDTLKVPSLTANPGIFEGVFGIVKPFFQQQWGGIWDVFEGRIEKFGQLWLSGVMTILDAIIPTAELQALNKALTDVDNLEKFWKDILAFRDRHPFIAFPIALLTVNLFITTMLGKTIGAKATKLGQIAQEQERPTLVGIGDALSASVKDNAFWTEARDVMAKHGLAEDQIDLLYASIRQPLPADMYTALWLRGELGEPEFNDKLKQLNIFPDDQDGIKKLSKMIPPVQDIIHMAVREVFSPEIVEKFGQKQDYPEDFGAWAAKKGLTREWAENYWAAHWSLPSVSQGFEMMHRGIITPEELQTLLRALDIMPYWRDMLTKMSFRRFTRVDARRMHKLGVFSDEELQAVYQELGYDETKSSDMADFTIRFNMEGERDLTKADILGAYERKIITPTATFDFMLLLGYGESEVNILMDRVDYNAEKKHINKVLSGLKASYVGNRIERNDAVSVMGKLNMVGAEIDLLFQQWDVDKAARTKDLSLDLIKRLFTNNLIKPDEMFKEITFQGYDDVNARRITNLLIFETQGVE